MSTHQPVFSSAHRLTPERLDAAVRAHELRLCAGAYGMQTDVQCLGYDHVCGLAAALYPPDGRDRSDRAVAAVRDEVDASPYSAGFADGWDRKEVGRPADPEYALGHADGRLAAGRHHWRPGMFCSDIAAR